MAPRLAAGGFVVILSPAELPTGFRVAGFWLPKVADPSIANRFTLTMASVGLVGLTILCLRTRNP